MYLPTDEENVGPHHKKKKDTKRWCKGKVGREHVPCITKASYSGANKCKDSPWSIRHKSGETTPLKKYICWHQKSCQNCGKVLEWFLTEEGCPDYKETNE